MPERVSQITVLSATISRYIMLLGLSLLVVVSEPFQAAHADSRLQPNQSLNGTIVSAGGRFRLVMQSDCNLVEYDGAAVLWRTGTQGKGAGCVATMLVAGPLIVSTKSGQVVWTSGSSRPNVGAYLDLQDDGNLVIYDPAPLTVLWARARLLSNGSGLAGADSDFINSLNGQYRLVMQNDCNLVLYNGNRPSWASNTRGRGVNCVASVNGNGHLQVASGTGIVLWTSPGTNSPPPAGAYLDVQSDGNLVLYAGATSVPPTGKALWASAAPSRPPPPPPTRALITAGVQLQPDQSYLLVVGGSGFNAGEEVGIAISYRPPNQQFGSPQSYTVTANPATQIGFNLGVICPSDSPDLPPEWQVTATGFVSHRTSNTAAAMCP